MESRLEQVGKFIKLPLYPRLLLVLDILLKPDDLTLLKQQLADNNVACDVVTKQVMDDPRRPAHLNLIDDYGEVLGYAVGVRRQFQFNVALN